MLPVSFASESTVSPPATIISSKRPPLSTVLPSIHIRHKTLSMIGQVLNSFPLQTMLYYITPALDGYISLLDRTPLTQMMMSLNICGTVSYDLWHPHSHPSLFTLIHPFCFHLVCFHLNNHLWTKHTLS